MTHYLRICLMPLVLVFFTVSCSSKEPATINHPKGDKLTLREAALFYAGVSKHVLENYVEPTSNEEMLEGALNGMLTALDPHSNYLSPKKYTELKNQTQGKFGGLGIEVTMVDGLIKIISPLDDTPAFEAGLQPGDLIVRIEQQPVYGMTLQQSVDLLKGKPGSEVEITIRRDKEFDFPVKIKRAIIKVHPVKSRIERDVGYIRIRTFNEFTDKEVKAAVEEFKRKLGTKLEGIVLDMRNNPGGLLDQAASVSNLFLDDKDIVTIKTRHKGGSQTLRAQKGDIAQGLPIAVLINAGSASAAEIVAGALQDHNRGIVLGTKSFGKGSVQSVIPLANGGAIKLTTALYYTPSGISIQQSGITPDIVIKQAVDIKMLDESKRLRESDFSTAVEPGKHLNGKEKQKDSSGETVKKKSEKPVDYQLMRAVDVLRGIRFYQETRK